MLHNKQTNKIFQQEIFSYNLVIIFCNILVITCQVLNIGINNVCHTYIKTCTLYLTYIHLIALHIILMKYISE